jgi:hypothetical protein
MKTARIKVSQELLLSALHMPIDTNILGARYDFNSCSIDLLVCHNDLMEINVNEEIPFVTPTITRIPERVKWDWNQNKKEVYRDLRRV